MASNVFAGYQGEITVSGSSSTAGATIGAIRNWQLNVTEDMGDATSFDSSGWSEFLPVKKGWTFTCEAIYLSTGATKQQDELRSALNSGTRKYVALYASTADQVYRGWAYVGGWDLGGNVNDIAIHNFSLTGDGALSEAAV